MLRRPASLVLLLAQLLAPAMGWGQVVLCVHPDGRAVVESADELIRCHSAAMESHDANVSAPGCVDYVFSAQMADQKNSSHRDASIAFLQLLLSQSAVADIFLPPVTTPCGICLDTVISPHHGPLDLLATVVLTN